MCDDTPVRDLTQVASASLEAPVSAPQAFEFHPTTLAAQISACVSATYDNGKISVHFPIVGQINFSVHLPIPNGTSVKVCMETCGFKFGVPPFTGIKATVYANGHELWTGVSWGHC